MKLRHPIATGAAVLGALAAAVSAAVAYRRRHASPVVVVAVPLPSVQAPGPPEGAPAKKKQEAGEP